MGTKISHPHSPRRRIEGPLRARGEREIHQIHNSFLLQPAITARAQEIYYRLSLSPLSCLMAEVIESERENLIRKQAQRAVFESDYKSKRQRELEERATELEAEGRRCWVMKRKHQARRHWSHADALWEQIDDISRKEKTRLQGLTYQHA